LWANTPYALDVPKYVLLLSSDPFLFSSVRTVLLLDPRFVDGADIVHCDGTIAPLTNIYAIENGMTEWQNCTHDPRLPDPSTKSMLIFECRSPTWVAEVCGLLAAAFELPLWVVDSDEKVWPAVEVDANAIIL